MSDSIVVPSSTITGYKARLIADQVPNPEVGLAERAIDQLMPGFENAVYAEATQEYARRDKAGETTGLPVYTNREAMCEWFLAQDSRPNATARAIKAVDDETRRKIESLDRDKKQFDMRAATEADADMKAIYQARSDEKATEIADLQATLTTVA